MLSESAIYILLATAVVLVLWHRKRITAETRAFKEWLKVLDDHFFGPPY